MDFKFESLHKLAIVRLRGSVLQNLMQAAFCEKTWYAEFRFHSVKCLQSHVFLHPPFFVSSAKNILFGIPVKFEDIISRQIKFSLRAL